MDLPPVSPGWSLTRRRTLAGALCGAALLAVALLLGQVWLFRALSWSHREPLGDPVFGINFSCNEAEFLLLETPGGAGLSDGRPGRVAWCADVLGLLLRETGARHVRISVEWDQVEPRRGEFDFRLIDAQLDAVGAAGASAVLSVGMKAQRHPEYYIPQWALEGGRPPDGSDLGAHPRLAPAALEMIRRVVEHVGTHPAVEGWLADNEPYHRSPRASNWYLGREFVQQEVAVFHAADPLRRPVAINHAERLMFDRRWRWALEDADVVATSIYAQRIFELAGRSFVLDILDIGPLMPNYAARARETQGRGKPFWITELQAEPWAKPDNRLISPANPALDMTLDAFDTNIGHARRSGAGRVYLWGAEWWLFQREKHGDTAWLDRARDVISGTSGGRAARAE
jgi:Beta-galactosidase